MPPGGDEVYAVERYWPGVTPALLRAALARLAAQPAVQHLGSVLVADEEYVLSVVRGPSYDAVLAADRAAGLPTDRVVPAICIHGVAVQT